MGEFVTIKRERLSPHAHDGEVVKESATLLLLHQARDFQFDGYCVIRKGDITSRYSSDSNRYVQELMEKEGLWEDPPAWVRELPLKSWAPLIKEFMDRVVILEAEADGDFYIGPIVGVEGGSAAIHFFNGCGELQSVEHVELNMITIMQFGDRYSTIHAKHLKGK